MKQVKVRSMTAALDAATKAIGGATAHAVVVGLKHNTAPVITTDKNAVTATDSTLDAAKAELKTRTTAAASVLLRALTFLTLARDMLKPRLGTQYNTAWDALGFVGSIKVPRDFEGVKFRLGKLHAFLTANVDAQSEPHNITPADVQTLLDDVVLKENNVLAQRTAVRNAVKARKVALNKLSKRIGLVYRELSGLVSRTDEVYLAFGFNIPGTVSIPEVPQNLAFSRINGTSGALGWDRAERATRYRIYKKVIGVDEEFILVETREELDYIIEGLPATGSVQVAVAAANSAGESQKSKFVTISSS